MARQQSGESSVALIITLAFFVLLSLALGVLTYMAYGDMAKIQEDMKTKEADKAAAQKKETQAQEKLLLYRSLLGVATEEDRTNLQNMREKDEVRKEWEFLEREVKGRVAGAVQSAARDFVGAGGGRFNVEGSSVFSWDWPAGGNLAPAPAKPVLDQMVAYFAAQQLGQLQVQAQRLAVEKDKEAAAAAKKQYEDAVAKLNAAAADYPKMVANETRRIEGQVAAARDTFKADTMKYIEEKRDFDTKVKEKENDLDRLKADHKRAQERIGRMEAELEPKQDPFEFDKPHGKVTRRRGGLVEVDLGSADNLRPGTTFDVQPSDTPERGFDPRKRRTKAPDGRVEVTIVPKGTVEIVRILGDHLAEARLTTEADPVRDAVLAGDLLYNVAWRKGQPDHVALIGIYDLNGDGTDDIKRLARDLTRMGIVVDAYFDLDQMKWVGKLSEKTIYAIEGNMPFKDIQAGEPAEMIAAKAAVRKAIDDARKEAKDRGVKVVRMRDFFPRIGYPVNLDVDERVLNSAGARYLKLDGAAPKDGM